MLIALLKNAKVMKNNLIQFLGTEEGEEPESSESKKASEYYAADPYKREIVGNEYSSDFTIAGGKTPPAKFTTDTLTA